LHFSYKFPFLSFSYQGSMVRFNSIISWYEIREIMKSLFRSVEKKKDKIVNFDLFTLQYSNMLS